MWIKAVNSGSDNCTGMGVVAGFSAIVLLMEGPHVRYFDVNQGIKLLEILQEVRTIYKTRNQLCHKASGSSSPAAQPDTNAAGGPQHDCIITMSVWDSDYVPLSRQGRRTIAGDSLRTAWPLVE
jgi:hypothetical protein